MLTGIDFFNYKPFKDGHIDIKPITILLGANSVGKSSLIQLFLMLQETALTDNYKSAIKLHGGFFSLGEGINLFRNKDANNTLGIAVEFKNSEISKYFKNELFNGLKSSIIRYCYLFMSQYAKSSDDKRLIHKYFKESNNNETAIFHKWFIDSPTKQNKIDKPAIIEMINKANELINKRKEKREINKVVYEDSIISAPS